MRRVSPNYAFLAAAGFALIAFAASLTTIVETGIKADVRASVVVDTYKAWHKKQRAPASWGLPLVPLARHRRDPPQTQRRRAPPDERPRLERH